MDMGLAKGGETVMNHQLFPRQLRKMRQPPKEFI